MTTENAVRHGYLGARMKGYASKRLREWRALFGQKPSSTGPNIAGWQQLAEVFSKGKLGTVQAGGDRMVSA